MLQKIKILIGCLVCSGLVFAEDAPLPFDDPSAAPPIVRKSSPARAATTGWISQPHSKKIAKHSTKKSRLTKHKKSATQHKSTAAKHKLTATKRKSTATHKKSTRAAPVHLKAKNKVRANSTGKAISSTKKVKRASTRSTIKNKHRSKTQKRK